MKIRIIHGFRGRETNEEYWPPESIQEVDDALARQLLDNGHAQRAVVGVDWSESAKDVDATLETFDSDDAPPAQDTMDSPASPRITTKRK